MWNVLPKFGLAKLLIFLLCLLCTTGVIWITQGWLGVTSFFESNGISVISTLITPVLFSFLFVTWILGTYGWRGLWSLPILGKILNEKVCPDLNGEWVGKIKSKRKDQEKNEIEKEVRLKIKASFFGFDMRLASSDGYQRSTVMQCELSKDPRDGSFYLTYVFEAVVDKPLESDDSRFDGAARLHIRYESGRSELVGTYWTNRCWQRGEQTAGSISLQKE